MATASRVAAKQKQATEALVEQVAQIQEQLGRIERTLNALAKAEKKQQKQSGAGE